MLDSVRSIFNCCNLDLDDVDTKIEQFKIEDGRKKYYEAPKNSRTLNEGIILNFFALAVSLMSVYLEPSLWLEW